MSNLTILERNTVAGFEHDDTQELYLRGTQKDELKAFKCACEWQDSLRPFMEWVKYLAFYPDSAVEEVIDFMRERQFRRYFPNQ